MISQKTIKGFYHVIVSEYMWIKKGLFKTNSQFCFKRLSRVFKTTLNTEYWILKFGLRKLSHSKKITYQEYKGLSWIRKCFCRHCYPSLVFIEEKIYWVHLIKLDHFSSLILFHSKEPKFGKSCADLR